MTILQPFPHLLTAAVLISELEICDAEELNHLIGAEDWAAAHQVLTSSLAAKWFILGGKEAGKLQEVLHKLQTHQHEIEDADGLNAYSHGAGLYHMYYKFQV